MLAVLAALVVGSQVQLAMPAQDKKEVLCWNKDYPNYGPAQIRNRLRKCSLFRRGIDFNAGAVHLRSMHWKKWGGPKAKGKGVYLEPMAPDPTIPIRVKLSQPLNRCHHTVYSKATFEARTFTSDFKLWTCDGRTRAELRGKFKDCGTRMPGPFITAKAHDVGCDLAHKVAKAYALKGNRAPHGFTCGEPQDVGDEAHKARCHRGDQVVKFQYGV
jgi:hypothetical protein